MDASFREINGNGCRMDVINLYDDDIADGYYYSGGLADGVQEGEGTSYRFSGMSIDQITYDELNGKDLSQFSFEEKYTGQFANGKPSGQGKLTEIIECYPDKNRVYTGHFTNGEKDGEGCVVQWREDVADDTITGEAYLGEFRNGVMTGKGKMKEFSVMPSHYADAEYMRDHFDELFCRKYSEGIFNGFMNLDGFGSTTEREGDLIWVRTGEFSGNQINGEGKCCLYKGENMAEDDQYLNDLSAFSPVWCYEGNLREGKPCDSGLLTIPASSDWYLPLKNCMRGREEGNNNPVTLKLEGLSGELDEKCRIEKLEKLVMPNGDTYTGKTDPFLRPDGDGTMMYAQAGEQLSYSGDFKEGKRHGTGKLMNGRKTVYEGEWCNDHITGKIHLTQKRYKDFL